MMSEFILLHFILYISGFFAYNAYMMKNVKNRITKDKKKSEFFLFLSINLINILLLYWGHEKCFVNTRFNIIKGPY